MQCPKCKSKNVIVNGLYYQCEKCGDLDDSTFSMIMEDEFNLSDKRSTWLNNIWSNPYYLEEYVKEFIKLEGDLLNNYFNGIITFNELLKKRMELAGDKLI